MTPAPLAAAPVETPQESAVCALCGLLARAPVRDDAEDPAGSRVFCCQGCRQVYRILLEADALGDGQDPTQTSLYQQCLQMGLIARPDDPAAPAPAPGAPPKGVSLPSSADTVETVRDAAFHVGGMWCQSCAWLIEHALRRTKGVTQCQALFVSDLVRISYKPARVAPEHLLQVVRRLGYTAEPYRDDGGSKGQPSGRASLARAVTATVFAMNAMMFTIPLYVGYFEQQASIDARVFVWASFIATIPVMAAGWPIFARAGHALRHGTATMETLITAGSWIAFAASVWIMFWGHGTRVYFDTAAMLIALVLVGKHLESGAKSEATGAIALLYGLLPKKAVRLTPEGRELIVAAAKLAPGDQVLVRPGDRVPADGRITVGTALLDESLLTGESRPVAKQIGDDVTGGTVVTDAPLTVEVTRVGAGSTVAQMIALVEQALAAKTPVERWADRISRIFVPAILTLALMTGAGLWLGGHSTPTQILLRMATVLVIACPCALGLATPMAITTAVGIAARRGILIVNSGVLEVLPRVRRLLLDKTGTLTEGRFAVRGITWAHGEADGAGASLAAIAALERGSEHPLAQALVAYAQEAPAFSAGPVSRFERIAGAGVVGDVGGVPWFVGSLALATLRSAPVSAELARQAAEDQAQGLTTLLFGRDKTVCGLISLGDAVRPGAAAAVRRLQEAGLALEVVSGDAAATTAAVSGSVGIARAAAGMTPADKVVRVREAQQEEANGSAVALAGDGVNDAPALAQADVGIAFGSGTEIARRAADITLVGDDLERLADLFVLARRTARVMKQNLFWACLYNAVCIPLAVAGLVSPIIAAGAMVVSSLTVSFNTKRLRRQLERMAG